MFQRIGAILLGVVIVAALGIGCGGNDDPRWEGETVKLGSIFSTSGAGIAYGPQQLRGAELAVEHVNEDGGISGATLSLEQSDDGSDPQETGSPDFADPAWDPFWEACQSLNLPVHFHIGASLTSLNFYGKYFWPSQHQNFRPAIGGAMLYLNNARVVINSVYAGIFDRFPDLKMVSVESGIGWVPFIMQAADYQGIENAPEQMAKMTRKPSEYFKDNWYATFWFEAENKDLQGLIDQVGEDNCLFETDFPHPTCLYPKPLEAVESQMMSLRPETRRKVLGENAAALYRI